MTDFLVRETRACLAQRLGDAELPSTVDTEVTMEDGRLRMVARHGAASAIVEVNMREPHPLSSLERMWWGVDQVLARLKEFEAA